MATYTIYSAAIENKNYTDGAEGWPVGTAKKLAAALSARFPSVTVEVVDNVVGGTNEDASEEIKIAASEILQTL